MNRRTIGLIAILALSLLSVPLTAHAPPPKVTRLGVLSPGSSSPSHPLEAFRHGLHELGYVEGQNLAIEWRFAEGNHVRLREFAHELVRLNVGVIFAINTPAVQAARDATDVRSCASRARR